MKPLLLFSTAAILLVIPATAEAPTFTLQSVKDIAQKSFDCGVALTTALIEAMQAQKDICPAEKYYTGLHCEEIKQYLGKDRK